MMGVFHLQLQVPSMWTMIIIDRFSEFYFISFLDSVNKRKRNTLGVIF